MPSINWESAAAIATVLSSVTFAASAIAVVLQLRQAARVSYFSVTAHLFEIWQSPEFQRDQLFLLHKLGRLNWEEFCAGGRGERAERAIHRVGGFYDRVGNLVKHNLIRKEEILPTIGGYAVAVWYRVEPLVKELRLRENAVLFQNYEALLPECHECYVPGIAHFGDDSGDSSRGPSAPEAPIRELPVRLNGVMPANTEGTIPPANLTTDATPRMENGMASTDTIDNTPAGAAPDFTLPDSDGVARHLSEFTGSGPAVVVYARGAHCPFCLRQLADYAERYGEFKRAGIEILALSPESQRKSRRLRTGLKLPFTVLSDARFEAAKSFGLMDHERPGLPTPATLVLDNQRRVLLSTLNEGTKSLLARDVLEYGRNLRQGSVTATAPPHVERPKAGRLFFRGLANMALGLVSG
jgi:peroxiredoxin Q/BCP